MAGLACVVDACVYAKVLIAEVDSDRAAALVSHLLNPQARLWVPEFFFAEISSILWKANRAGVISAPDARLALADLQFAGFRVADTAGLCADAFSLAVAADLSPYDGCYLALAARQSIPLVTADTKLFDKARAIGIDVQQLSAFDIPKI